MLQHKKIFHLYYDIKGEEVYVSFLTNTSKYFMQQFSTPRLIFIQFFFFPLFLSNQKSACYVNQVIEEMIRNSIYIFTSLCSPLFNNLFPFSELA